MILMAIVAAVLALPTVPPAECALERLGSLRPRTTPDPKDERWMVGCEVLDRDFARFAAYKDYLPLLGIRSIRLQGGWAKCERTKGQYDFAWLDEAVDFARAHGLNPVLETDYGNPIYPGGGGADLAAGFPSGGEGLAAWDRWVDALSRHFKGRVRDWAMWNEPDIGNPADTQTVGGHYTPAQIAAFNVRTAKIIRANIPEARIAGLSLATNDPRFFEACLKGLGKDIGLFSRFIYHGYAAAPEESYGNVETLQRLVTRHAPHATLWQGENGAPSEMPGDGLALNHIAWSEVSQAKWDLRRMLGDCARDIPSSVFTICDYFHPGRGIGPYGLLRADSARNVIAVKQAFRAVRSVATLFDSATAPAAAAPAAAPRLASPEKTLALSEYVRKGSPLFVFWTCGAFEESPQGWRMRYARPGDDLRTRPIVLEHAGEPLRNPVWIDLRSGSVCAFPTERVLRRAGGTTYVGVPAYDSPCVLTARSAIDLQPERTVVCDNPHVFTDAVRAAQDGDTIRLVRGTYHFGEEGAKPMLLSPSNNLRGEKKVVFPLVGKRNVTIDGGGSTLVFHGRAFPFAATNCTGIALRNFTVTTRYPSCAGFAATEKTDAGFTLAFDEGVCPFRVENGNLTFELDGHPVSTRAGRLSLHALDRLAINYLMTPDSPGDKSQFPAPFVGARPVAVEGRKVRFAYTNDPHPKSIRYPYGLGERVVVNLEETRAREVFFLEDCSGATIADITIRRFGGMGVLAQRSGDVRIERLNAEPNPGERVTLTADIIQFVNCWGDCAIRNCSGGHSLDDWVNVHGNYLMVSSTAGRTVRLQTRHPSHAGFFPYRVGDTVEFATAHRRDVLSTARVVAVQPDAADPSRCSIGVDRDLPAAVAAGIIVENASLSPNVTLTGNHFIDYPHLRLSGRGRYLIADNIFERGNAAVLGLDLADYWYESGRIADMTIRGNLLRQCGGFTFGLSGWSSPDAPKIHGRIRIEGNTFESPRGAKWSALGVRDFLAR